MGNADEAAPDQGPEQAAQEAFHLGRRGVVTGAAAVIASVAAEGVAAQGGIVPEQGGPTVPTRLAVNGADRTLELDPRSSLLDVLRERLALTGAKKRQPVPLRRLRRHRRGDPGRLAQDAAGLTPVRPLAYAKPSAASHAVRAVAADGPETRFLAGGPGPAPNTGPGAT